MEVGHALGGSAFILMGLSMLGLGLYKRLDPNEDKNMCMTRHGYVNYMMIGVGDILTVAGFVGMMTVPNALTFNLFFAAMYFAFLVGYLSISVELFGSGVSFMIKNIGGKTPELNDVVIKSSAWTEEFFRPQLLGSFFLAGIMNYLIESDTEPGLVINTYNHTGTYIMAQHQVDAVLICHTVLTAHYIAIVFCLLASLWSKHKNVQSSMYIATIGFIFSLGIWYMMMALYLLHGYGDLSAFVVPLIAIVDVLASQAFTWVMVMIFWVTNWNDDVMASIMPDSKNVTGYNGLGRKPESAASSVAIDEEAS